MDVQPIHIIIVRNRLRDLRREFAVTQEELALAVGVSRQSIISVETGKCLPSVPLAMAIAQFFRSPLENLFITDQNEQLRHEEEPMNREINPFRSAFDRMIEDSMLPMRKAFDANLVPQMNVYQTEKELVVEADVPGMTEDDIDIEIHDGVLTIKGERNEEKEEKQKEYFHREVAYGSFQRAITLPLDIDATKASATVRKGQLKVVLPKLETEKTKVHKLKAKNAD